MRRRAAVTVNRSREEVMRLWPDPRCRIDRLAGAGPVTPVVANAPNG